MDFLTYLIGFSLVIIGAAFFGYPLGKVVERRGQRRRRCRAVRSNVHHRGPGAKLKGRDVLSADTLEESDAWPDVVFTSEVK